MYFVYILKSQKTGKYYIGYTNNIARRIKEHNSTKKGFAYRNQPFVCIKAWKTTSKTKAQQFERSLKKMKGGVQFKKFMR